MASIRKGDVGTIIRWTAWDDAGAVNISIATVKQVKIIKPNGTKVIWPLSFSSSKLDKGDGTDGRVEYITVTGDSDQKGTYKWQLYFNLVSWNGSGNAGTYLVEDVLF